jgi:phosphatidylglycerol---prolipoprotein diacylglyceryl transferase
MELLFVHWNIDPTLFSIGPLHIRYYGLSWAIALIASYILFNRFFKDEKWNQEELDRLTTYVVLGTIVGARLGHCLFYEPAYYLSHPVDILKIWQGGLASHGAAIGILTSLFLYHRKNKSVSMWWLLDRISIAVAIAGAFVRLGNLMNSEIYGTVTTLPWGFIFVRNGETLPMHPTQLYEALSYFLLFIFLFVQYKKKRDSIPQGLHFGIFLVVLFMARFLIEFIKNVQVDFEKSLTLNMGQMLSVPFILSGIAIIIWSLNNQKK